jgi:outer membrane protein assembly factor BamE
MHTRPAYALARGLLLAAILALGACVYRINIQQGNYLDPKALEQLQPGMTRNQVRYLLGTPMVADAFDPDRWDYVYYFKRGRLREPEKRKVTVYFEEDAVVRIERPGDPKDRVAQETEPKPQAEASVAEAPEQKPN